MASYTVTVAYKMEDGRTLYCEYDVNVIRGNTCGLPENCYPDEVGVREPVYSIDDEEIAYSDLPVGLVVIADEMYDADDSDKRFTFTQTEPDYDPPDFEDDY